MDNIDRHFIEKLKIIVNERMEDVMDSKCLIIKYISKAILIFSWHSDTEKNYIV